MRWQQAASGGEEEQGTEGGEEGGGRREEEKRRVWSRREERRRGGGEEGGIPSHITYGMDKSLCRNINPFPSFFLSFFPFSTQVNTGKQVKSFHKTKPKYPPPHYRLDGSGISCGPPYVSADRRGNKGNTKFLCDKSGDVSLQIRTFPPQCLFLTERQSEEQAMQIRPRLTPQLVQQIKKYIFNLLQKRCKIR